MTSKVFASIRVVLLNDFSIYREKILLGLEKAGLYPKGYQPKDKAEFLQHLADDSPNAILMASGLSEFAPFFEFEQVQDWLAKQDLSIPIWLVIKPEDEAMAIEAMYNGLTDYFFTDRLSRLAPVAARLVGRNKMSFEPVALDQVLEDVIKEYAAIFQAKEIGFNYLPGVDLPEILGEPGAVAQAISSVLGNVVKAAPPGTKVDIRSYLDAVKGEVSLEIKMSGVELQTEQQIEATAVNDATLRVPREIVETQDGRIELDRGEAYGIRLCVSLPAILEKQVSGNPKLLIVENSLLMRSILQEALEEEGFRIETAEQGVDALGKMAEFRPDLIISDIVMPVMDGFTFFEAVRENPVWQDIPFIFVTGQSDQKELLNTKALQGATYLIKPIIIEELLVAVRSRLTS